MELEEFQEEVKDGNVELGGRDLGMCILYGINLTPFF